MKPQEDSIEFTDDLWQILRDTELVLREMITATMLEAHGETWIEKLEKEHPDLKHIFDRCRQAREEVEKVHRDLASQNLIDFTYLRDLFTVICAEGLWKPYFEPIFGHNLNYWKHCGRFLTGCRDVLVQNRSEVLQVYELEIIEGYCEGILSILSSVNSA